jgi:hypothetical protein
LESREYVDGVREEKITLVVPANMNGQSELFCRIAAAYEYVAFSIALRHELPHGGVNRRQMHHQLRGRTGSWDRASTGVAILVERVAEEHSSALKCFCKFSWVSTLSVYLGISK